MPDWSYHNIFKPFLSKLPESFSREFIHRSISTIASLPFGQKVIEFLGHFDVNDSAKAMIGDILLPNRVGLSGKIDPFLSGTKGFTNLGFGFIEIGPVSLHDVEIHQTPKANFKTKEMTFPNVSLGYKKVILKLEQIDKKQPFMIRLTGSPDEVLYLASKMERYGDLFVIETLPNEAITFLHEFKNTLHHKPIFLSLPSHVKNDQLSELVSIQDQIAGVVIDEVNEQSNEENKHSMIETIHRIKSHLSNHIQIITSGGVREPKDAIELYKAGAEFVMVSCGYVFSGPGLPKRINEAVQYLEEKEKEKEIETFGWQSYWLFGFGIFLGGLIALILSMTTIILPYDEAFLNITREDILAFNERVLYFMSHDRMTLAGTMISAGIVYMQLAKHGVKYQLHWTKKVIDTAAICGFLGFLLFIGYGYFDWLHLIFYLLLLPFFLNGYMKTKHAQKTPKSLDLVNDWKWRLNLIGQLSFVILGAAFIIGGIVISTIGVSTIFVPTDIEYICMPKEILDEFNDRLIPVIAHDRAGFGTALISTGLLVFLIALWGFRREDTWIWWTLTIGGIPAFFTGFWAHFMIGYTSFIHLLPAYFALALYLIGVVTTYPNFKKQSSAKLQAKRFLVFRN